MKAANWRLAGLSSDLVRHYVVAHLHKHHGEHEAAEQDDEGAVDKQRSPDQCPVATALQAAQQTTFVLELAIIAVEVTSSQRNHTHARKDEHITSC